MMSIALRVFVVGKDGIRRPQSGACQLCVSSLSVQRQIVVSDEPYPLERQEGRVVSKVRGACGRTQKKLWIRTHIRRSRGSCLRVL